MIEDERLQRLRETMASADVPAVLTADPINLFYATGARNMTVFSMMGAARFAFIPLEGPVVVWEFAGAEHLTASSPIISETRTAPGITAVSGPSHLVEIATFAAEVHDLMAGTGETRLAVERFDHPATDALRSTGLTLLSATETFCAARAVKTPAEIDAMTDAMASMIGAVESMRSTLAPGRTEVEVWAELHRSLIADNGEYISTRLAQAGHRTFPYFNEAGTTVVGNGDLFCIDTDAIGRHGYGVDFSRTFVCGDRPPSNTQQTLHALALEQLQHNAALLAPGRSFESFAQNAWEAPPRFREHGYFCLAHGLGLSGEHPYVPRSNATSAFPLPGHFEPGMVICVESYIGDPDSRQGAKVEDQFRITETGSVLMSTMAHGLTTG
jgi:Xaa-Pro aminopeptidase